MKKILAFFLLFAACSSEPKKAQTSETYEAPQLGTESGAEFGAEEPMPPVIAPASPAKKAALAATGSALDEALKSQNDERIYQSATAVLMQNPTDVKALNALAVYHYKKGQHSAAKYFLASALRYRETSEAFNNLGVVHLALSEKKEAIQAFRQALRINSQEGAAAANLGAIYVQAKNYNKAVVPLEMAYERGYRDVKTLNNYAIALTAQGKYAEAERHYEKALKDSSQNKEILLNYSILLIEHLKKYRDGLDVLNRLKFVGSGPGESSRVRDLENKAKSGLQN